MMEEHPAVTTCLSSSFSSIINHNTKLKTLSLRPDQSRIDSARAEERSDTNCHTHLPHRLLSQEIKSKNVSETFEYKKVSKTEAPLSNMEVDFNEQKSHFKKDMEDFISNEQSYKEVTTTATEETLPTNSSHTSNIKSEPGKINHAEEDWNFNFVLNKKKEHWRRKLLQSCSAYFVDSNKDCKKEIISQKNDTINSNHEYAGNGISTVKSYLSNNFQKDTQSTSYEKDCPSLHISDMNHCQVHVKCENEEKGDTVASASNDKDMVHKSYSRNENSDAAASASNDKDVVHKFYSQNENNDAVASTSNDKDVVLKSYSQNDNHKIENNIKMSTPKKEVNFALLKEMANAMGSLSRVKCAYCRNTFKSRSTLQTHVNKFHTDKTSLPYTPSVVHATPSPIRTIVGSAKKKANTPKQVTTPRNDICFDLNALAKESNKEESAGEFVCPVCAKILDSKSILLLHINSRHILERFRICLECVKIFENQEILDNHVKQEHQDSDIYSKILGKTPKQTTFHTLMSNLSGNRHSPFASSNKISLEPYKQITEEISKKVVFQCTKCSLTFESEAKINDHFTAENGCTRVKERKEQTCPICLKVLKTSLSEHMRTHSDERPYECTVCSSKFKRGHQLKMHMQSIHSDEAKFECEICSRKFKRKDKLTCHYRSHTDDHPYMCVECGNVFKWKHHVKRHMLTVHQKMKRKESLKRHPCQLCDKSFAWGHHLKRHLRNVHSVDTSDMGKLSNSILEEDKEISDKSFVEKYLNEPENAFHKALFNIGLNECKKYASDPNCYVPETNGVLPTMQDTSVDISSSEDDSDEDRNSSSSYLYVPKSNGKLPTMQTDVVSSSADELEEGSGNKDSNTIPAVSDNHSAEVSLDENRS